MWWGEGDTWQGGVHGWGACMGGVHGGGHAWWGGGMCGRGACMAGETATAAEGTHPTGLHSCLSLLPLQLSFFQCHLDVSCDDKLEKNSLIGYVITVLFPINPFVVS